MTQHNTTYITLIFTPQFSEKKKQSEMMDANFCDLLVMVPSCCCLCTRYLASS